MLRKMTVVFMLAVASAWAGVAEDVSAFNAKYAPTVWNNPGKAANVIAEMDAILAAYPDMTAETKKALLVNGIEFARRCAGSYQELIPQYDRVLAATDANDPNDYQMRRNAVFLKGWCQAQPNTDSAKATAVATLESALAMPRKAGGWDNVDWQILYHIAHYSSQTVWSVEGAKILQARVLVDGAQYAKDFPMNEFISFVLRFRYIVERDFAGGTAFMAAHPFVLPMLTEDYSVTAQVKQGAGDYVGAKEAFLGCFRTLKVGGNVDQAMQALQAVDVENLFATADEQVAFYNLLLRVVPATEGNAKFLGLVKSQIEAMKP